MREPPIELRQLCELIVGAGDEAALGCDSSVWSRPQRQGNGCVARAVSGVRVTTPTPEGGCGVAAPSGVALARTYGPVTLTTADGTKPPPVTLVDPFPVQVMLTRCFPDPGTVFESLQGTVPSAEFSVIV